ncbi:MAG: hypothetical protein WBQ49_21450 [Rhodomicrobium sp.]
MYSSKEGAARDAFFWKVVEQFEGFTRWIAEPFIADAWEDGSKAIFTLRQDDYELLRFSVTFDDEGARERGWDQKLSLVAEWQGNVAESLGEARQSLVLGWKGSEPDLEKGLDSWADFAEGELAPALGDIVSLLRDKLEVALASQSASISRLPARRVRSEPARISPFQAAEPLERGPKKPAASRVIDQAALSGPELEGDNIGLLKTSLGAMAEIGLLQTETVFADFIQAARLASLRQRQVAAFARSALLDLYLVEKEFFEAPSWRRPSGVRIKGGSLMEGVLRTKASMFGRSRSAQENGADRIVAAMEGYYREVLIQSGRFPADEVDDRVKRAFGSAKAIVDKAVEGFRSHVWPNWARIERVFARRIALD